jgi:hypothetical protein
MKALLVCILLSIEGCAILTYDHVLADGQHYHIWGAALGTTKSIEDFKLTSGDKSMSIGKFNEDQTKGVEAIVAGAIKGASMVIKP